MLLSSTMIPVTVFVTVLHLTWATTITPSHQGGEDRNISACINQTQKTLFIDCEAGNMLRINALFYGYGDQCGYSPGDCLMKDPGDNLPCVGHRTCSINLPSGELGRKLPGCDLYSTYIQVNYQCVPEKESYDICRTASLQRQWAYIHTPRYPNDYKGADNCTLHVVLQHDQKIRLYVLDFDLESEVPTKCVDDLYIQSPLNSQTMCGKRKPQLEFTSHQNTMSLTFNSNGQGNNKGFWLYYEADPLRPDPTTTTTTSTTTTTTSTTRAPSTTSSRSRYVDKHGVTDISTTSHHYMPTSTVPPTAVPVAAIVGGILGAVLFILLFLVILLICKRNQKTKQKESEMKYSNSTNYLNSKAPVAHLHGTPGPYIQNNLNLHNELDDHDKLFYKDELVHKV